MSWFKSLFGGGSGGNRATGSRNEFCMIEIVNEALVPRSQVVTMCFTAEITGGKLRFRMSPEFKSGVGASADHYNPLTPLQKTLGEGERLIVTRVDRQYYFNEVDPGKLQFSLVGIFDTDEATNAVRQQIDAAQAGVSQELRLKQLRHKQSANIVNSNNNHRRQQQSLEPPSDIEGTGGGSDSRSGLNALMLTDSEEETPFGRASSVRELAERMDTMASRYQRADRNVCERDNTIKLGPLLPATTDTTTTLLYSASASKECIQWFAGQDHVMAQKPAELKTRSVVPADGNLTRSVETAIYQEDHALVLFILKFRGLLGDIGDGIRPMTSNRGESGGGGDDGDPIKFYGVDEWLVNRAQATMLYSVFAQIYYTTLRDCYVRREYRNEEEEAALVQSIAAKWGLKRDETSGHIMDWEPGAYRPVVVMTIHIDYVVVKNVRSSAAALYKTKTTLTAAKK